MSMVLMGVGGLFMLIGFIFWVIVLINAFKTDTTQGILSLCIFPYMLYWVFAKFTHPKKGLIIAGLLGGYIIGYGCYFAGVSMAASAVMDAAGQYQMPAGVPGYPPAQ